MAFGRACLLHGHDGHWRLGHLTRRPPAAAEGCLACSALPLTTPPPTIPVAAPCSCGSRRTPNSTPTAGPCPLRTSAPGCAAPTAARRHGNPVPDLRAVLTTAQDNAFPSEIDLPTEFQRLSNTTPIPTATKMAKSQAHLVDSLGNPGRSSRCAPFAGNQEQVTVTSPPTNAANLGELSPVTITPVTVAALLQLV